MSRSLLIRVAVGILYLMLMSPVLSFAQQVINGKIISKADQSPVPSATILIKGTRSGTSTNIDGLFSIRANLGDVLIVSGVGVRSTEFTVDDQTTVIIDVEMDPKSLTTVLVTALGIRKESKRLGYSIQEVKGSELVKAREPNPVNGLAGKIAGLTVAPSAEILGVPALILRGSDPRRGQQPLFVVDGVPISSDTYNFSPDDVESFTILKGPTAASLYGYRGQNGAIIINTKKGSKDKRGFSIEVNSSLMFDKGFNAIPKVQDQFGPGDHGKYAFVDGRGGGLNDGDYDIWGPKFDGQLIPQYDSPVDPVTGVRQATPWVARGKNNLTNFLQTGILSTNNIAVSSSSEKSDLRFSVSNTYNRGIVPNTSLNALNFNIANTFRFSSKLKFESVINFSRQFSDNFPDVVYGPNSIIYNMIIWGAADWNVNDPAIRAKWQPGKEGVQSLYAEYQRYHNPWFMVEEWPRGHFKNDVYGYFALTYKIMNNLEVMARSAVTTFNVLRTEKMPFSAHPYGREEARGDYREDKRDLFENNTDLLLSYTNNGEILKGLDIRASAGGNLRSFKYNSSYATTDYLNVPEVYNFSNSRNPVKVFNFDSKMQVWSWYGFADISYKNYVNLSLAGRWDKLSTLPAGNNLFFYPSASLSTVISEYVDLPDFISFLKVFGSVANVKGGLTSPTRGPAAYPLSYGTPYVTAYDGPTYENTAAYSTPLVYNNQPAAFFTNTISNPSLKPFSRTNYETGIDIRFLGNRLALDVTYFLYKDGPGIFQRDVSEATGYIKELVNGIETQRKGWEVSLTGTAIRAREKGAFSWDVMVNWSTYKETLAGIYQDQNKLPSNFFIGDNRGDRFIEIGDRVDAIYGGAFHRDPNGALINDAGGRPFTLPKGQLLGYANPDWVWGINNRFGFKNFMFSFQFDGRVGGSLVNYIQRQAFRGGRHIETTEGAMGEARLQDVQGIKSFVGSGVVVTNGVPFQYDENGNISNYKDLQFGPNTTKQFLQDYISRAYSPEEGNIVSKTFTKLREVILGYTLPDNMLGDKKIVKQVSLSFVARNLFYFSKVKDVDLDQYPGFAAYSTLQTPTTKRYGFNINFVF
jgi:TonB-linked SusC/RagA family outer membrane protein